ncbi:peroxiredoxin [Kallotenue papyrolyticum]|uniref:peroxiredoxin n=1 Tax=Kallotenue papyrolyticum TaxID=1325125 RepID=UPI00049234C4|nr:peroxiredoxin [Kallotenue papyrolyticum]
MTHEHQSVDERPVPIDDGACDHLLGLRLPPVSLPSTAGRSVTLATLPGRVVVYAYPRTARPDEPLPPEWDTIPGARGCTAESCAFRDHAAELRALGVQIYGLSTQSTAEQREAAQRLGLPFELLSDAALVLTRALRLPTFVVGDWTVIKRLTLILRDGVIEHVFYPVFPPEHHAGEVLAWLRQRAGEVS